MTTRYQKRHYEDVARLLYGAVQDASNKDRWVDMELAHEFADLFAADNPSTECCKYCGVTPPIFTPTCLERGGGREHVVVDSNSFNRKQFLEACGLESGG